MSTTLNNIQVNGTSYNIRNIYYGELTSTASTATKVATTSTSDNFSLAAGNTIVLSCGTGHGNTVEGAITLNIDSTGAKNVYYHGVATSTTNPFTWSEGSVLTFVYDGTNFIFIAMDKGGSGGSTGSGIIVQDENGNLVVSDIEGGVAYTEGAGIDIVNGVISAEVTSEDIPTKTSDLTNDSGFVTTDTKNTAGATNSTSALYLVGATEQTANPQTYTNTKVYTQNGGIYSSDMGTESLIVKPSQEDYPSASDTEYAFTPFYANLMTEYWPEDESAANARSTALGVGWDSINLTTKHGRTAEGVKTHIYINTEDQTTEIHELVAPTANTDAANKKYVDDNIPTATSDLTNDSNFITDASYVHTDNNYTSTEKSKLSGIASGAEVNVQADWNVTTTTSDAYIKNKPTIPTTTSQLTNNSGFIAEDTNGDISITRNINAGGDIYADGRIVLDNNIYNVLTTATPTAAPSQDTYRPFGRVTHDLATSEEVHLAEFGSVKRATGESQIYLQAANEQNGTRTLNMLYLGVDANGTPTVTLNRSAWLNALGLTTTDWAYLQGNSSSSDKFVRWRAKAGIVLVEWFYTTGSGHSGSTVTLGTIPDGYRPSKNVSGACYGTGNNVLWWEVSTSGKLTFGSKGSSSPAVYGTASYPL